MTTDQWLRAVPWFVVAFASVVFVIATVGPDWWRNRDRSRPMVPASVALFFGALAGIACVRLVSISHVLSTTTERRITYVALWLFAAVTVLTLAYWLHEGDGSQ